MTQNNVQICWRPAALLILMLLAIFAPLEGAIHDQTWPAMIDGQPFQLKLEGTTFSIAAEQQGSTLSWVYAGSLEGFEPGRGGIYEGDLDGTGQTSLAFYDVKQHVWYHGVVAYGQITFQNVPGEVFQIGNGPTLYPLDDLAPSSNNAALTGTMQAHTAQPAPTFPVEAEQYTKLGTSRSMDTTVTLYADGGFYAVTLVHNGVWLSGYHGRAQVTEPKANHLVQQPNYWGHGKLPGATRKAALSPGRSSSGVMRWLRCARLQFCKTGLQSLIRFLRMSPTGSSLSCNSPSHLRA